MVPAVRIRLLADAPPRPGGAYVLYWMIASRRTAWNFGLQRAIEQALALRRPLLVFEPLRVDAPWASARFHHFVRDGMRDNAADLARGGVTYYPYLEPTPGAARGLFDALAADAAAIVTDDFPSFFLPRMTAAAAARVRVRMEAVDGNGLLPLAAVDTVFPTAYAFRRVLQRILPPHLEQPPDAEPLAALPRGPAAVIPSRVLERWPAAALDSPTLVSTLPIDQRVGAVADAGGGRAARAQLAAFLATGLGRYAAEHNQPEADVTSRLSPYLHWGHVSVHEIFAAVMARAGWMGTVGRRAGGAREGWWGVDAGVEAFLDQLVTWRELGLNMSAKQPDCVSFESLPPWALRTLRAHADDPRDEVYSLAEFEQARTADPLWNAAQRQLLREGRIHNYLRMLWGKKILHWSRSPEEALAIMLTLNDKYALDGRDPNSISGIFWVLGRYDRPWGPERPIFGTVRYMSSDNTARKLRVKDYLRRYAEPS